MQITVYSNFSKKVNSTKQPTGGTTINVRLKENTSIESPIFLCESPNLDINYVKGFNHYYFVNDIILVANNLYEIHCTQDVLATYKNIIGSYNCFVERSASAYDVYINDSAITQKQKIINRDIQTTTIQNLNTTGCYFLRVVGQGNASDLGITTYALSANSLKNVLSFMFDSDNEEYADVFTDDLVKSFFNPFQYILSCKWMPVDVNSFTSYSPIKFGWFKTGSTEYAVVNSIGITFDQVIGKPTNYYNDFRAYNSSWTKCRIYLPCIGMVDIDPIYLDSTISAIYDLDYLTGDVTVQLTTGSSSEDTDNVICTLKGNLAVDIQIGQLQGMVGSVVSSTTAAFGAISNLNAGQTLGSLVNGATALFNPTPSVTGNLGNRQTLNSGALLKYITMSITNYDTADIPTVVTGRPLCKNVTINTLHGFVKCSGASLDVPSLGNDKNVINNYLNTGFYYE